MALAVPVREAAPLCFQRCLKVRGAWGYTRLQRGGHFVVHRPGRSRERGAADMQALDANDVAIVELAHQQEELGLRARVGGDCLVHAAQGRHGGLCVRQIPPARSVLRRLGRLRSTARGAGFGRLRSPAPGLHGAPGPGGNQVTVCPRAIMEKFHERTVGIREVRRRKEARAAEEQVAAVAVEAQLSLPAFRAGDLGRAEQEGAQSGLYCRRHHGVRACLPDGFFRAGDVHSLHEVFGTGVADRPEVGVEAFPADGRPRALEQAQAADHVAQHGNDFRVVEPALARGLVGLRVVVQGVLVFFEIDQAPRHLFEEHRPLSVQARRAIPEPPLHVAGGIRARVEGVQGRLRRDRQGRRTDVQPQIGLGDDALHGGLCALVKAPRGGLQVQDQGLQALTPPLVHNRLKSTVAVLDFRLLLVPTDLGGLPLHARDVRLQGSHHLHRLHVLHGIHGDGSLRDILLGLRGLAGRSGLAGFRVF